MKICLKTLFFIMVLLAAGCSDHSSQRSPNNPEGAIGEYDFSKTYDTPGTIVRHKGTIYANNYWANPNECPVESDCKCNDGQDGVGCFAKGRWTIYDPEKPHEFTHYDYPAIQQDYPEVNICTEADYDQAAIIALIDASIASGDLAEAAPEGGYTQQDKEALYREYMLPCVPDFSVAKPANVETVERVMPYEKWKGLAKNAYAGDKGFRYFSEVDGELCYGSWPAEDGFTDNSYDNFLKAVARYPFFCGEKGYFDSLDEACKRELASLFAHAAQETGGGDVTHSFYYLREYGFVNGGENSYFKDGCAAPFDCSRGYARYYGRGPKQLTYYYNYAGFSAAYFNGDYNFLLHWPDMVAYDGAMFFTSAIWFVMTHQPPKPSIHDVMLGRYQPADTCNGGADCCGLAYDATSGVKHNFNVTIEVVNGGPECRGANQYNSKRRSDAFIQMLDLLDAVKTGSELNPVDGCDFIAETGPDKDASIFAVDPLDPQLHTWLNMAKEEKTCRALAKGGAAMISVTAPGIVAACKKSKP